MKVDSTKGYGFVVRSVQAAEPILERLAGGGPSSRSTWTHTGDWRRRSTCYEKLMTTPLQGAPLFNGETPSPTTRVDMHKDDNFAHLMCNMCNQGMESLQRSVFGSIQTIRLDEIANGNIVWLALEDFVKRKHKSLGPDFPHDVVVTLMLRKHPRPMVSGLKWQSARLVEVISVSVESYVGYPFELLGKDVECIHENAFGRGFRTRR